MRIMFQFFAAEQKRYHNRAVNHKCMHGVQGCGAGAGGKLTARNVAVCDSQCSGFRVWGGASADLQACKVTKCGDTGVLATDPSSSLLMMVRTSGHSVTCSHGHL